MTRTQRLLVGSIVVAVASVALAVVRLATLDDGASTEPRAGERESPTASSGRPVRSADVLLIGGSPKPRRPRIRAREGDEVRLTVTSRETEDEVLVRGHDVSAPVAPGRPARLTFRAGREGFYDVILVASGATIADLDVMP